VPAAKASRSLAARPISAIGAKVFADTCTLCHSKDGLGQRTAKGDCYQYPPLVGPDSYNNGADMTRVLTAAAFVRHNMPYGVTFDTPLLPDADAYDVAAYINSLERPTKANLDEDFPNKLQKPVDTPYGPYLDDFPPEQLKYGPFDPIRTRLRELAAARK
jgi:thiosulfate dehydrogenase